MVAIRNLKINPVAGLIVVNLGIAAGFLLAAAGGIVSKSVAIAAAALALFLLAQRLFTLFLMKRAEKHDEKQQIEKHQVGRTG